jgi:hypothetical protein
MTPKKIETLIRRIKRLSNLLDSSAPLTLVVMEAELIIKAYYGSIPKFFLNYLWNEFSCWCYGIIHRKELKKEADDFMKGMDFVDEVLKKIKEEWKELE